MQIKKFMICTWTLLFLYLISPFSYALMVGNDGFGQTIQITTRFRSFVGNPSLLIIVRDVDNNQNIPYLFDITSGDNSWFLFTYGRNYLITVSNLQIHTFKPCCKEFRTFRINDFCHLESKGRILRGESLLITIAGDLTPNPSTVVCHVTKYPDTHFMVSPTSSK